MSRPFENWARTVRTSPRRWERPGSEDEVVALVRRARAAGERLKVSGARHSWSPLAAGDDVQVELHDLDRFVAVDRDACRVTVQAGCTLATLVDVLATHDLALPVLGSITAQTVAGAIATGTHGSTLRHGNLGTLVTAARLVDGTGEVVVLEEGDPRLPAVRVHLGALGLLTEVTLAVVPAFRLEERRFRLPFDDAAAQAEAMARDHAFVKLWWLPPSDDALVFAYDLTDAPGERSALAWTIDGLVNRTVFPAVLALGGRVPPLIPTITRTIDRIHLVPGTRRGRSDHLLTLVMPPRHRETELAVEVGRTAEAMHAARDCIGRQRAPLDFIQEVRFVRGDDSWMSPASGRDTCQLGMYGARSPAVDAAFTAFQGWGRTVGARPHWGKETTLAAHEVDALYPDAPAFRALAEAFDPDGLFRTPALDAILGRA
ncbi:MAG: FAD-binding protein [Alphaproteobacteria bacterium]|nr:FAD-binding protein [Alphaproteobacteria bacterium]